MRLLKTTIAALGLALALIITPSQIAQAAEFTVTDVSAVLWTNEATQLCSDADTSTVAVPIVEAGLPVQVTGITDNGFFQVLIGTEVYYIPGIGLSADTSTTTTDTTATATTSSTGWTQESVYAALMNLKATKYPEGTPWENVHDSIKIYLNGTNGKIVTGTGYDCYAFICAVLKDIFGEDVVLTSKYTYDINDIKIGDVIILPTHYAVVLTIEEEYITVVEGNYHLNGSAGMVHWGRKIAIDDLFITYYDIDEDDDYDGPLYEPCSLSYYTAY